MSEEIKPESARNLIDKIGPHIQSRCDRTSRPFYPETRKDVCAIKRSVEDGYSYGYDTLYLVYKGTDGLEARAFDDTRHTKDYMHIEDVVEEADAIAVRYSVGGHSTMKMTDHVYRVSKQTLGLD